MPLLALGHNLALSLLTLMLGGALTTKPRATKRDATTMIRGFEKFKLINEKLQHAQAVTGAAEEQLSLAKQEGCIAEDELKSLAQELLQEQATSSAARDQSALLEQQLDQQGDEIEQLKQTLETQKALIDAGSEAGSSMGEQLLKQQGLVADAHVQVKAFAQDVKEAL